MAGVGSSSCGACKFLRRKCVEGCVFAPHFSYDQGAIHFSAVHKVFGASNVSKLLLHLPVHRRSEAAATVSFEAQARMRDPVYGCVAYVYALQQQVARLQEEVESLSTHLSCTFNNNTEVINNHTSRRPPTTFDSFFNNPNAYQNIPLDDCADHLLHACSPNVNANIGINGLMTNTDDRMMVNVEGLHPLYREAIDRLEHSLLDDIVVDQGDLITSLDDGFTFDVLEDFSNCI